MRGLRSLLNHRGSLSNMRPNPWMLVLWLLAATLTGAGVTALAALALTAPDPESVQSFYVVPRVLGAVAPWLLVVGIAAGVGALFLQAIRWRRG